MDLEGKLIYHCRAGPVRVEPKTFAHGSFARPLWECYGEHPLSVLGDVVVRISGAVIRLYAGERELPGHLDKVISSVKGVSA